MLTVTDAHDGPLLATARELLLGYLRTWVADGEPISADNRALVAGLPGRYAPPEGASLVAFESGRPLGCVFLAPHTGPVPGALEIKHLYVVESLRGHRVGRTLLDAAARRAAAMGRATLLLDVDRSRTAAVALYESAGFRPVEAFNAGWPAALHLARPVR
ncbi:MAG: hypothetical protein QOI54_1178 [Actinomycetota bacterium]|nr:hypothetical protein [Actinomycetota bacterium]